MTESELNRLGGGLWNAAWGGHLEDVKSFLAKGAPVNWTDDRNRRQTPLMAAIMKYRFDVVALLAPLSDMSARDERQWTPLHYAAEADDDMIRALLPLADANLANELDETPLMVAVHSRRIEHVRALLPASNLDLLDRQGQTALESALWLANGRENDDIVAAFQREAANRERAALLAATDGPGAREAEGGQPSLPSKKPKTL
jgi:ankyrin repeat protein